MRQVVGLQLRDAIRHVNDRVVLVVFFILLFYFYYWANLLHGFANLFSVESDVTVSRTLGGAEILGLAAVAVVLKDLKSDRVLRWWDFVAITATAIASIYSSRTFGAIGVTCLGVLFVARSDKRIASLGQLCLGFAWLGFWGPLALDLIKPWLLPIETALAYAPLSFLGSFSLHGHNNLEWKRVRYRGVRWMFGFSQHDHDSFHLALAHEDAEARCSTKARWYFGDWSRRCHLAEHGPHRRHGSLYERIHLLALWPRLGDHKDTDVERGAWLILLWPSSRKEVATGLSGQAAPTAEPYASQSAPQR